MRTKEVLDEAAQKIREYFGDRCQAWQVAHYAGYGGHLRVHNVDDVTFADLQAISDICGGTKDINMHHEPASGSEFTPSGDYMEIVVWGPER